MNPYPQKAGKTQINSSGDFKSSESTWSQEGGRKTILEVLDFPDMIEEYLIELEIRNYSLNTIKTYKSIVNNFYKFLLGEEDLYDDRRVLRSFKRYIQFLKRDKKVSQNYIYLVTVVVKKFLEYHDINILNEVKTPKRTKSLPKSLNETEVKNLINAVECNLHSPKESHGQKCIKLRNKVILALLYSSGLRISELVSLRSDDVDPDDRTIRIRGKGEKDRIVLFDEETKNLIKGYITFIGNEDDYLFLNRFGNPITPRYVQMMIKNYALQAGIKKKVTPHILRHSFATHLLKNGVDIRAIQQLLGHSNLSTTQIYTSVDMQTLRNVYDRARLK
ncbi:MAG: tyrosine-type recombinase/integrase [Euryarchaeota archaeon]|nr:tyrosine-type recombinase/integrase [Euryarchaeota archaeon]MBU4608188.1 tyrosine-type recombinase/integrase [Euryarchaeota archaeon]MBV1729449.1 tyrosine-type recombinase/integrase [Methanobacterium sp.]MBV1756110.1 tyrosine-type recombinase/integrase [Methanobacterium sp.]